jgi:hypothetical protein
MMKKRYIRFNGDYSKLKKQGFKFQKLYAANYMQWCRPDLNLRVWKKGGDVTLGRYAGFEAEVLCILLNNPIIENRRYGTIIPIYINRETNEVTQDKESYYKGFMNLEPGWESVPASPELYTFLLEWYNKGIIELKEEQCS